MKIATLLLLTILVLMGCVGASASDPFVFDNRTIERGQRTDLTLKVKASNQDPATHIPVSIVRGVKDGPSVLMVAGVHGYEFSPMLAADQLARDVKPSDLRGTLVIVRVAHVAAFENRSPYVNPYDRKNLNRSFPGAPDGTQTERIAHVLSTLVIPSVDFVFDVHSGDGAEWLEAFVGVYGGPLASEYQTALGVAKAMGFPNIVRYKMNTQEQVDRRRSLNRQAVAEGLPTVLVEVGENGSRNEEDVELIVGGVKNALAYLDMLPDQQAGKASKPRFFDGTQSVPVTHSGLWTPTRRGGPVAEGETLGTIRSYEGQNVETVKAPVGGFAIYGLAGPPVRKGDSVMTIAAPIESL